MSACGTPRVTFTNPTTGSYKRRVADTLGAVQRVKSVSVALDESRLKIESAKETFYASYIEARLEEIRLAEKDAISRVSAVYESERSKLFELLRPFEDRESQIDHSLSSIETAIEYTSGVCNRSRALVDHGDELRAKLQSVATEAAPLVLNVLNGLDDLTLNGKSTIAQLEAVPRLDIKAIRPTSTTPPTNHFTTTYHRQPDADSVIVGSIEVDAAIPVRTGSIRVYLDTKELEQEPTTTTTTSSSATEYTTLPYIDCSLIKEEARVDDLIEGIFMSLSENDDMPLSQSLDGQVYIFLKPSGTVFPLRKDAILKTELKEFKDLLIEENPISWPRLLFKIYNKCP